MLRAVLIVALVSVLGFLAVYNAPRLGGRYLLRDWDHGAVMTSGETPRTTRTVTVLFIGNSYTSTNDLPAMLVNLAAADPENPVELSVMAFTRPGASLRQMLKETGALDWARANPPDYVVLQEQSQWYTLPQWTERAQDNARDWRYALSPLKSKLILFEPWADLDGSETYTDPNYCCYGRSFKDMSAASQRATAALAQELDMAVARVARAYYRAVEAGGPNLFQRDLHHPSYAGTYLAALTFYRIFTNRSGGQSRYRPWGLSAAEAAVLVRAAGN